MNSAHIAQLVNLYRTALKWLTVATALSVVSVFAELVFSFFKIFIPYVIGGGVFTGYVPLVADAIAWPGIVWLYRSAKSLESLGVEEAKETYAKMWGLQSFTGTLVTIGAIVMIPGSFMAIQMGIPGLAIIVPIFAGAWIHSQARGINRSIKAPADELVSEPKEAEIAEETKPVAKDGADKNAGMLPLWVAASMLIINLLTDYSLLTRYQDTPSFIKNGTMDMGLSMTAGLAAFGDVAIFGSIGVVMLVLLLKARKRMPKKRFFIALALSIAQLAYVPNVFSPMLARTLGPSAQAAVSQSNMDDSVTTLNYIRNQATPEGFVGNGEVAPLEEINASFGLSVNTGAETNSEAQCKVVIDYAKSYGATDWIRKDTNQLGKLTDSVAAVEACTETLEGYPRLKVRRVSVYSSDFIMAGTANFGLKSPLIFTLSLLFTDPKFGENPNTFVYNLTVGTAYQMNALRLDGGLSQGTVELDNLLNLIGQARLASPDRNPTDPAFMREILATYKYKIPLKLVESKPGVANRIEVKNSDGTQLCLSVDPWDEAKMAQADPGWYYGVSGSYDNLKNLEGFGNYVAGSCK